jgi:hypothetical protein
MVTDSLVIASVQLPLPAKEVEGTESTGAISLLAPCDIISTSGSFSLQI